MTLSQLQSTTFQHLRDPARTKYDVDFITQYLNDAERLFCSITEYSEKNDTSIITVAGKVEYATPSDYKSEIMVLYKGTALSRTTLAQVQYFGPTTGSPEAYYMRNQYLGLFPAPGVSGDTISLVYNTTGGSMVSLSDESILSIEHQRLLPFYAAYICCLEGDDTRAAFFANEWEKGLLRANQDVITKAFGTKTIMVGGDEYMKDPINHDVENRY
jgi:hypothetical protein